VRWVFTDLFRTQKFPISCIPLFLLMTDSGMQAVQLVRFSRLKFRQNAQDPHMHRLIPVLLQEPLIITRSCTNVWHYILVWMCSWLSDLENSASLVMTFVMTVDSRMVQLRIMRSERCADGEQCTVAATQGPFSHLLYWCRNCVSNHSSNVLQAHLPYLQLLVRSWLWVWYKLVVFNSSNEDCCELPQFKEVFDN
jgi:hypothetical protein